MNPFYFSQTFLLCFLPLDSAMAKADTMRKELLLSFKDCKALQSACYCIPPFGIQLYTICQL